MKAFRFLAIACALVCCPALAVDPARDNAVLFNWYYAAAFGSGAYRVGEINTFVLRLPLAYRLREASAEHWGLRLIAPISAGVADIEPDDRDGIPDTLTALAASVGAELEIPMSERWMLKPLATLGSGQEFASNKRAMVGVIGAKSLYRLPLEPTRLDFGSSLLLARARTDELRDDLGELALGLDWLTPVQVDAGEPAAIGVTAIQYWYFRRLRFLLPTSEEVAVRAESELAISLRFHKPQVLFGSELDRVSLGVRVGKNLRGIALTTSFPF
jgi:hypothetical protein